MRNFSDQQLEVLRDQLLAIEEYVRSVREQVETKQINELAWRYQPTRKGVSYLGRILYNLGKRISIIKNIDIEYKNT